MPTAAPDLRGRAVPSWTATLLLAGCWLAMGPATPDLAAQVYRAGLFAAHGFAVWDNGWYDGHHLPGYSLVFPAVGSILGVRVTGAAAAVASAALFQSLVRGRRAQAASWWFAIGCVADLVVGRLTYALGVTAGLAAIAALTRGRPVAAAALAVICAATSPVAGLFLALAGIAIALAERRSRAIGMSAGALTTTVALTLAFPEGGTQPFTTAAFAEALALSLVAAAFAGRDRRLRPALVLYVAAVVACFVVASPMGGNVTRLGTAFLAPALLLAPRPASPAHRVLLLATLVTVAAWQWVDPITQAARGRDDPSTSAAYYRPLVAALGRRDAASGRVEVPFTRDHWETVYLARHFALARGWERQLDRRLNPLFYERRLDPAALHRWLRANAVRYVALPDAPMDPAGRAEAAIVAAQPAFLRRRLARPSLAALPRARPAAAGVGRRPSRAPRGHRPAVARESPRIEPAAGPLDPLLAARGRQRLHRAARRLDAAARPPSGALRAVGALLVGGSAPPTGHVRAGRGARSVEADDARGAREQAVVGERPQGVGLEVLDEEAH